MLRMASAGMLRHVALVRTDVSEEFSASFIRMTIGELAIYNPTLLPPLLSASSILNSILDSFLT
jgi:hypothetical protein